MTARLFMRTSKWRWGPVERPVLPINPITSPAETSVPMRVRKRKRQLFGRATFMPLRVVATPTAGGGVQVETPGQLVVRPPLEAVFVNRTAKSGTSPDSLASDTTEFGIGWIQKNADWSNRVFLSRK